MVELNLLLSSPPLPASKLTELAYILTNYVISSSAFAATFFPTMTQTQHTKIQSSRSSFSVTVFEFCLLDIPKQNFLQM